MFGRGRAEVVPEYVPPSQEERAMLIDAAQARIEVRDGVDYLDGFKLPPDNEEIWNPQTFRVQSSHIVEVDGKLFVSEETLEHHSRVTNSYIREINISTIATSGDPLFKTWEEVMPEIKRIRAEQKAKRDEKYAKSWRGRLGKLFFGVRDDNTGVDMNSSPS